ncbi:MAG: hypothetical protein R3A43_03240 [Bacteroidia bacterium]
MNKTTHNGVSEVAKPHLKHNMYCYIDNGNMHNRFFTLGIYGC